MLYFCGGKMYVSIAYKENIQKYNVKSMVNLINSTDTNSFAI